MNEDQKSWALAIVSVIWAGALIASGTWVYQYAFVVQTDPEGRRYQDSSFMTVFCVIFVSGLVSLLFYVSHKQER